MSRIGNKPVNLPNGVNIHVSNDENIHYNRVVNVKGPLGNSILNIDKGIDIIIEGEEVKLKCLDVENKNLRAKWGLYRSLIYNMVVGVSVGFKKEMELIGVGYRASANGTILDLSVGHSHHDILSLPPEIKISTTSEKGQAPRIILESIDKQLLGQVCARIRAIRPPEPYKGKGIRFVGEKVRRKAGKTSKK